MTIKLYKDFCSFCRQITNDSVHFKLLHNKLNFFKANMSISNTDKTCLKDKILKR